MNRSAEPREEVLARVGEYVDRRIGAADLAHYLDASLSGFSLYPPDPVLDVGHAAGQLLENSPDAAVAAVLQLTSSDRRETRAIACCIIARVARYSPAVWAGTVRHLAADSDWEVRSFAACVYDSREGYSGAVEFHTEWVFEEVSAWAKDENYLLRYAATQALLAYAGTSAELARRASDLLEPLLSDAAEYVRHGVVVFLRTIARTQPAGAFAFIEAHLPPASREASEIFQLVLEQRFADKDPARKQELMKKMGM